MSHPKIQTVIFYTLIAIVTVLLNPRQQPVPVHRPGADDPAGPVAGPRVPRPGPDAPVAARVSRRSL